MFRSTETAAYYGLAATENDRLRLAALRKEYLRQGELALARDQYDLCMMLYVQAQFCREALDADAVVAIINKIGRCGNGAETGAAKANEARENRNQ
jgi:hypothetical protein